MKFTNSVNWALMYNCWAEQKKQNFLHRNISPMKLKMLALISLWLQHHGFSPVRDRFESANWSWSSFRSDVRTHQIPRREFALKVWTFFWKYTAINSVGYHYEYLSHNWWLDTSKKVKKKTTLTTWTLTLFKFDAYCAKLCVVACASAKFNMISCPIGTSIAYSTKNLREMHVVTQSLNKLTETNNVRYWT